MQEPCHYLLFHKTRKKWKYGDGSLVWRNERRRSILALSRMIAVFHWFGTCNAGRDWLMRCVRMSSYFGAPVSSFLTRPSVV